MRGAEARDVGVVVGVPGGQRGQVARQELGGACTEGGAALVIDERVVGDKVDEARADGTLAEVVLLAIAVAEGVGVEAAHGVERAARDQHAEADARGCLGREAQRALGDQRRETIYVVIGGQRVVLE